MCQALCWAAAGYSAEQGGSRHALTREGGALRDEGGLFSGESHVSVGDWGHVLGVTAAPEDVAGPEFCAKRPTGAGVWGADRVGTGEAKRGSRNKPPPTMPSPGPPQCSGRPLWALNTHCAPTNNQQLRSGMVPCAHCPHTG